MAEKQKEAPPAAAAAEKEAPAKKSGMKIGIAAAVVVLLEVATVLVTMKLSGGPKHVIADPPATAPAVKIEKDVEVKLVDARFPNIEAGRLWIYDFQVVVKVAEMNKEKVTSLFAEKEFEIRDQMRTIIASALPEALAEPGKETIRRQVMYQLEQDIGKDLIKEVLIPKCTGQQMP